MRLGLVLAAAMVVALVASAVAAPAPRPVAVAAAVCADYPNQAAAQRAADTRDADGDGIYCEDLPCPCAGPGSTTAPKQPAQPPATFNGRCKRGRLPDHACTPGVVATTNVDKV